MTTRGDNPLMRAVARLPTTVRGKLVGAFVGIVALVVVVGILGLRVLGASNDRVETLGNLQQRLVAYRVLKTDVGQLQLLLALRTAGSGDQNTYVGATPSPTSGSSRVGSSDDIIASTIKLLGPDVAALDVTPPDDERALINEIHREYGRLSTTVARIVALDMAGRTSEGLHLQATDAEGEVNDLESRADQLVGRTETATTTLIAQNQSAYTDSQHLFMAVAATTVVLALLLGLVLSWSLIEPIRRMTTRLAAISSGDFSGHVVVRNRDELGALAADINRMNDELGRLYREVETVSNHKSEFLANMSHELRTPLNAIIGFSQVLDERMFGELNDKQVEYVGDILTSGQHLLSLINDILDLAKVESGRMELHPRLFHLPGVLQNAAAMIRERATRQGVAVAVDIDDSVGLVEADERSVKQVLFNLLSNAVKFTPAGGRVTVIARSDDERAEISVCDTGIGMAADDLGDIFDEFRQLGPGRVQEGTGLGLPLARRLVEIHGGELRVESTPGAGSTFTFTLPLRQAATADTTALLMTSMEVTV